MPMPFGFRYYVPQQVWLTSRIALPTDGLAIAQLKGTEVNALASRVMLQTCNRTIGAAGRN
jgi:hypothetical protein